MTTKTFVIPTILSAALVLGLVGLSFWQQRRELEKSQRELVENRNLLDQARAELAASKAELSESKAQIEALQGEQEKVSRTQKDLEEEMRRALESRDITISELQGKLTVSILDRIMFDSGEAILKSEGELVLRKIASILEQYPKRQVHVIGHTDNVPIRPHARGRFPSNWELSTARATAAVRFLSEKAGVDPRRLGAVGYGEFHPIADNATPEGRAKNRRIALVVLSEELIGSDAVPGLSSLPSAEPAPGRKAPE